MPGAAPMLWCEKRRLQQIEARLRLDKGDLNAVQRSGVGEDDKPFGETQWLVGEELHSLFGQAWNILFEVRDLQREVVDAFASSCNEPGYRAARIIGGNEADGGIAEIEAGSLQTRVGVVGSGQGSGRDSQDSGVDCGSKLQVPNCYPHIDEAFDHRASTG